MSVANVTCDKQRCPMAVKLFLAVLLGSALFCSVSTIGWAAPHQQMTLPTVDKPQQENNADNAADDITGEITDEITDDITDRPLTFTRYTNPDETFALHVPDDYAIRWAQGLAAQNSSRYGFVLPRNPDLFTVMVDFVMAEQILSGRADYPAAPLDDEAWPQLIDGLLATWLGDGEPAVEIRNDWLHTAYINFTQANADLGDLSFRLWFEERDGVVAALVVAGTLTDDQAVLDQIFNEAYSSFTWHPAGAMRLLALDASNEPYVAPTLAEVEDPLLLIWPLQAPVDYPLVTAVQLADGLEYRFGETPRETGGLLVQINRVGESAMTADEWTTFLESATTNVLDLAAGAAELEAELSAAETATLPATEPTYGGAITNSALVVAESREWRVALRLQEMDGLLATALLLAPLDVWDARVDQFDAYLATPLPLSVAAIDTQLKATQNFAGTPQELILVDRDGQQRARFANDEVVTIRATFPPATALNDQLNLQIFAPWDRSEPWVAYALDMRSQNGIDADNYGLLTGEDGSTEVRFTLRPDPLPLHAGEYHAQLVYRGIIMGQIAIRIENQIENQAANQDSASGTAPEFTAEFTADIAITDESYTAPLLPTLHLQPTDHTVVRATGNMAAGSQLRLLIHDGAGWLPYYTAAIDLNADQAPIVDWLYFYPDLAALTGTYTATITLDGEMVWSAQFTTIDPDIDPDIDPKVVAMDGSAALYAQLLPADHELIEVPTGIDIGVMTRFSATRAIDGAAAWLRSQGWQQTLPLQTFITPHPTYRWSDGETELIIEVVQDGADAEGDGSTELWYVARPIDPESASPPPAATPLTAATVVNAVAVGEVGIAGAALTDGAISPNGYWLAVTTDQGQLVLIDARTLSIYQQFTAADGAARYTHPTFSPDSGRLAVAIEGDALHELLVLENGGAQMWQRSGLFGGHSATISAIHFVEESRQILTASCDGTVRSWWHQRYLATVNEGTTCLTDLALAPDGSTLLVAHSDGVLTAHAFNPEEDPRDGAFDPLFRTTVEQSAPRLLFYPFLTDDRAGQLLIYNGDSRAGEIALYAYNPDELSYIGGLPFATPTAPAGNAALALDPTGTLLATAEGAVTFLDVNVGKYIGEWWAADGTRGDEIVEVDATSVQFSPDGRYLLVLGADGDLHLWAVAAGTIPAVPEN